MKTFLLMVEVEDKDVSYICDELGNAFDNPEGMIGRLTAYQMYNEDEMIPDIMKRDEPPFVEHQGRRLYGSEQKRFLDNRNDILRQAQELQADFEDLSDEQLVDCRECMGKRVDCILELCLESEEDNLYE